MIYIYDHASDNWTLIKTEGLINAVTEFNGSAIEGAWYVDEYNPDEFVNYFVYDITVEEFDTEAMQVSCSYSIDYYDTMYDHLGLCEEEYEIISDYGSGTYALEPFGEYYLCFRLESSHDEFDYYEVIIDKSRGVIIQEDRH